MLCFTDKSHKGQIVTRKQNNLQICGSADQVVVMEQFRETARVLFLLLAFFAFLMLNAKKNEGQALSRTWSSRQ